MNARTAVVAVLLAGATGAQAALLDRGNGLIYDTELNITWLQDWNLANTAMTWAQAMAWADTLSYGGHDDWRLPTILDTGVAGCNYSVGGGTDCGYNVQTKIGSTVYSEMAHLWYVTLGNKAYCRPFFLDCFEQPGWGLKNTGPFTHLQSNGYWSGTVYAPDSSAAWGFGTSDGLQAAGVMGLPLYAVAVRAGDVVAAVPEPQTFALMLLGLGVTLMARKR